MLFLQKLERHNRHKYRLKPKSKRSGGHKTHLSAHTNKHRNDRVQKWLRKLSKKSSKSPYILTHKHNTL